MSWVDILIIFLLAGGLIEGALRGFIRSVVGLVATACGIYFARMFGEDATLWVTDVWQMHPLVAEAIAYALVFAVISFAVSLLARLLGELLRAVHLSGLNRTVGALFGLLKGLLAALIVVFAIERIDTAHPFLSSDTRDYSLLYKPTYHLANACLSITRSQFESTGTDDLESN